MRVATVLYEDKMRVGSGGEFPPHDFVLAMVHDLTGQTMWDLRKLVDKNPRNGVSKLIADLGKTSQLAGSGKLCVLVDRDKVFEHLGLAKGSAEGEVTAALLRVCRKTSDSLRPRLAGHLAAFVLTPSVAVALLRLGRSLRARSRADPPSTPSPEPLIFRQTLSRSDAPEKLSIHFLDPNMEGLLRSIAACAPSVPAPASKDPNARDVNLNRAAFKLSPAERDCVKGHQPSLAALVDVLADLCRGAAR